LAGARPSLPEGSVLVVGLARSGSAAARVLSQRGYDVTVVDSGVPEVGEVGTATVVLETDGLAQLEHARWVVKSPGVPRAAPVIAAALDAGLPVMGELELGWRLVPGEFIAVTGTNGKTTTTELIAHIHRSAGLPVRVAGNVGTALSELVGTVDPDAVVICECSSFQLEDSIDFAPEAAVLLNVMPDHLDRHGTLDRYRDAKLRIFANQGNDDIAVAPAALAIEDLGGCARRVFFGDHFGSELALHDGLLLWDQEPLIRVDELALRGAHNAENAAAAAAVCLARGIDADAVVDGLKTFAGVEHRLESLGAHDGVEYVNDSKATNVNSTLVALEAFGERPVRVILGGEGKGQDFTSLGPATMACAGVYLIGAAAGEIETAIGRGELCGTLKAAVASAGSEAEPGDVILLSPACASFDQFKDFEDRGRAFKELVPT
jgi:UDP-N-acetylmuramoylalanine--D-glutamate ligase